MRLTCGKGRSAQLCLSRIGCGGETAELVLSRVQGAAAHTSSSSAQSASYPGTCLP